MTSVAVFPIVEGHGEVKAVPRLLHRVWAELSFDGQLRVLDPFRLPRGKMTKTADPELARTLTLARHKLTATGANRTAVLLLLDADDDCASGTYSEGLGPFLRLRCRDLAEDLQISVVAADRDFEAWLLAGEGDESADGRKGKSVFKSRLGRWSESVDQPRWTSNLDIELTRAHSRSFDKLCREVERWTTGPDHRPAAADS